MDKERDTKIYRKLSLYDKGVRGWEWTDLISWMQEFKSELEEIKDQELGVEVGVDVAKRVAVCLNPSLPQGVHVKALEIYEILMVIVSKKQFFVVLLGLLAFFPIVTMQIKLKMLEIIQNELEKYVNPPAGAIISGLLRGGDESGEVFNSISNILHLLHKKKPEPTNAALWRFLLKSSHHKLPALLLLKNPQFLNTNPKLSINAILSSLSDENLRVKRHSLDLIKDHFPLKSTFYGLPLKKILLKSVLIELDKRESSLCRRLWEWVFPVDMNEQIYEIKLLSEAYLEMAEELEDKELVVRTADLICSSEFGNEIFERVGLMVIEIVVSHEDIGESSGELMRKIIKMHSVSLLNLILVNFKKYLMGKTRILCLMIEFLVDALAIQPVFCFNAFQMMMDSLPRVSDTEQWIGTLSKLSNHVKEVPDLNNLTKRLCEFLGSSSPKKILIYISEIYTNLKKIGYNYEEILINLKFNHHIKSEFDIFSMMNFVSNFENAPISVKEIQFIWKKLINHNEAYELLLRLSRYHQELINAGLIEILRGQTIGISAFLKFWEKSIDDETKRIINEKVISMVINLIDNHEGLRQWIDSIGDKVFIVADYLIEPLLDPITIRESVNEVYFYNNAFDTAIQASRLKTLKIFIQNLDQIAIKSLNTLEISKKTQAFFSVHNIPYSNYTESLVNILLFYIETQPFSELTFISIECLVVLLKFSSHPIIYSVVQAAFKILQHAISQKHYEIQLSLLTLSSPLLNKLKINDYILIFNGSNFTNCLLQGCFAEESLIRSLWHKTIIESFPLILTHSQPPSIKPYLSSLLTGIHHYLIKYTDFSLLTIMSSLILLTLNPSSLTNPGIMTIGICHLELCIRIACDSLILSKSVVSDFSVPHELRSFFAPISKIFLSELFDAFLLVWNKFCQLKPDSLNFLLELLSTFAISTEKVVDCVQGFVEKRLKEKKNDMDVYAVYFLVRFISELEFTKISLVSYQMVLYKTVGLMRVLLKSLNREMPAMLVKVIYVLGRKKKMFYNQSDKTLRNDLKEIVERVFETIFTNVLICDQDAVLIPYPDLGIDVKIFELCIKYMHMHAYEVADFAFMGDKNARGIYLSNSCLKLLFGFPKATIGKAAAIKFILKLVQYRNFMVVQRIKKQILELFYNDEFFLDSGEFVKDYLGIISEVSNQCFKDKQIFFKEIIEFYSSSWDYFRKNTQKTKNCLIRICFLILSGNIDDYTPSLPDIHEKIQDCLSEPSLLPLSLALLKVFSIKLSPNTFSETLTKYYPCLFITLTETILTSQEIDSIYPYLRLLEFLSYSSFETLEKYFSFFIAEVQSIEISNKPNISFTPSILRRFLPHASFKPQLLKLSRQDLPLPPSLFFPMNSPVNLETLENQARTFINLSMYLSSSILTKSPEQLTDLVLSELICLI